MSESRDWKPKARAISAGIFRGWFGVVDMADGIWWRAIYKTLEEAEAGIARAKRQRLEMYGH